MKNTTTSVVYTELLTLAELLEADHSMTGPFRAGPPNWPSGPHWPLTRTCSATADEDGPMALAEIETGELRCVGELAHAAPGPTVTRTGPTATPRVRRLEPKDAVRPWTLTWTATPNGDLEELLLSRAGLAMAI